VEERVIRTKINLDPKVNLEREDIVIAVDSTEVSRLQIERRMMDT
jgi:hypothetical protein